MPKEFLWKRLPQAFPPASFHIGKAWGRNMEKLIPKPFPHHRERGLGSVEKDLVPSLLSLRMPFPQAPTWGKARFGEITKPLHMETKRGNGE
jgi:hypothetical protein